MTALVHPAEGLPRAFLGSTWHPRTPCTSCTRAGVWERADGIRWCGRCGHEWAIRHRIESDVVAGLLQVFSCLPGVKVWRQNTGCLLDDHGRPVRFGVRGGADVSGLVAVWVRGRKLGIRLETEAKHPDGGDWSDDQRVFCAMIKSEGGIYILTRSVEDGLRQLDAAAQEISQAIHGGTP